MAFITSGGCGASKLTTEEHRGLFTAVTTRLVKQQGPVAAVLRTLASHGPASRTELAGALGVSAATLTRTIQTLADRGLVQDTPVPAVGPGRPVQRVSLVPRAAALAGVKLTDEAAWGVLMDPAGEVLTTAKVALIDPQPEPVVALITHLVTQMSSQVGTQAAAVGVSLGASVVGERVVRVAPFLGWRDVDLAHQLTDKLAVPVRVGNDVRALAYSAAWYGPGRGIDPFALVTVGAGIGCGLVVRGEVVGGAHGAAGSVGHMPVQDHGPRCEAGHRGCARALASTSGIESRATKALGTPLRLPDVLKRDRAGDTRATEILDSAARALGTVIGAVTAVTDPGLVVISGESAYAFEGHQVALREGLDRVRHWSAPAPSLQISPLDFHDWALGAAALAVTPWAAAQ